MKEPKKPNQAILDYISTHYQYDPDTGIVIRDGKKTGGKRGSAQYVFIEIKAPNPINDGSVFLYTTTAHRIGWYLFHGQWAADMIDHIDGNPANNRLDNLRLATPAQNAHNSRKRTSKRASSSPFKGVFLASKTFPGRPWRAVITQDGESIFLGFFATEVEAAQAYDAKAKELRGEFARLNFPDYDVAH